MAPIPWSSKPSSEAKLQRYRAGFRDPFMWPRGFPLEMMPFTGGSSSSGGRLGPTKRRNI